MTYATELNKPEYQSLTNPERLELIKSKTETKIGWIQEGNLKRLESIIAKGLWRDKMEDMKKAAKDVLVNPLSTEQQKTIANAQLLVVAGFHEAIAEAKLANKAPREAGGHSINMNDPEVYATFIYAKNLGLITQSEVDQVLSLAQYNKPLFPDVTLHDIISHFNPELINGQWYNIGELFVNSLTVKLKQSAPTATYILFQSRDVYVDVDGNKQYGEWTHNTALHGVELARVYRVPIRNESGRQEVRWSCAYNLDVEIS